MIYLAIRRELVTYGEIARAIGDPRKAQDVGMVSGDNRIAFLIPCHWVIKSTGELGHYHWGAKRKAAMIGREAANVFTGVGYTSIKQA